MRLSRRLLAAIRPRRGIGGVWCPDGLARRVAGHDRSSRRPLRPRARRRLPSPPRWAPSGPSRPADCPIPDPAFCTPAAALAEAIVAGDTAAVVGLSRADVFTCADLDASIFTDCASADVLEGHPIGTAGGDDPGLRPCGLPRRARGQDEGDRSVVQRRRRNWRSTRPRDERVRPGRSGSSFLLRRLDRRGDPANRATSSASSGSTNSPSATASGWSASSIRDTVASWQAQHADPLRDVGCGVSPWGAG